MSSGQKQPKSLKYSDAGVDIDEGDALIGDIAPHAKRTKRAGASTNLGGFGPVVALWCRIWACPGLSPRSHLNPILGHGRYRIPV